MNQRPFRFGTTATAMSSRQAWRDNARRIEDAGFAVLTVMDHLGAPGGIWAALASAHDAAPALRLGTLVLNNDLWNAAVLAREAISLDVLTDGRLELGIGAGWSETDYTASGVTRLPPRVRIERLGETLEILRQAFAGEPIRFDGKHYTVDGGAPWPAPRQDRLPLLVGGGSPKVLRLAARHADIVSVHRNLQHGTAGSWSAELGDQGDFPDAVSKKVDWVRSAAGPRYDSIELHALILKAVVTERPDEVLAELARGQGLPVAHIQASPHFLVGTVDTMVEELRDRRARWGISYWTLAPGNDITAFSPVVTKLTNT